MLDDPTPPELRAIRDMALYETFARTVPGMGFTTWLDDIEPDGVTWLFTGDFGGDENEPGAMCVLGKIHVTTALTAALITTIVPYSEMTLWIPMKQ